MKLDFSLSTSVCRVLLQQQHGTVLVTNSTPFTKFSVHVNSLKKIIFIHKVGNDLKILGVVRFESVTSSLLSGETTTSVIASWARSKLKVSITGKVKLYSAQDKVLNHPDSVDLGRRFEYGESAFPVASVCGVRELLVDVPFMKERWKHHYDLLTGLGVDATDLPKLTYLIICMFAWRSRYVSEKIDSLLQLQILNYEGDCEDQALEIARVIRGALREGGSFAARPEVRWLQSNVEKAYLVSGVADPGYSKSESNYIGHCWAAVKLKPSAAPSEFGLSGPKGHRLAYLEGTNPVSWGWTNKLTAGCAVPSFAGRTLRNANKGELVSVKFLFDERARYDNVAGGESPFLLSCDTASFAASHLSTALIAKLKDGTAPLLKAQLKTHMKNLTTFSPLIMAGRVVRPKFLSVPSKGNTLVLKEDDVFGAYYALGGEAEAASGLARGALSV